MNYEREIMSGINGAISDSISEFERVLKDNVFAGKIIKTFSEVLTGHMNAYVISNKNGDTEIGLPVIAKAFHKGNGIFVRKIENALSEAFDAAIHEFENQMSELSDEIKDELLKGE